jgi:hypothetical protein
VFYDSFFELADCEYGRDRADNVAAIDGKVYGDFIEDVMWKVLETQPGGGYRWKDDTDLYCARSWGRIVGKEVEADDNDKLKRKPDYATNILGLARKRTERTSARSDDITSMRAAIIARDAEAQFVGAFAHYSGYGAMEVEFDQMRMSRAQFCRMLLQTKVCGGEAALRRGRADLIYRLVVANGQPRGEMDFGKYLEAMQHVARERHPDQEGAQAAAEEMLKTDYLPRAEVTLTS